MDDYARSVRFFSDFQRMFDASLPSPFSNLCHPRSLLTQHVGPKRLMLLSTIFQVLSNRVIFQKVVLLNHKILQWVQFDF